MCSVSRPRAGEPAKAVPTHARDAVRPAPGAGTARILPGCDASRNFLIRRRTTARIKLAAIMSPAPMEHADGLPQPQRNQAVLTIGLGITMAVVDSAIANVALPTIAADLNASPAFSIWIVNGYQLAITISLLPLASIARIIQGFGAAGIMSVNSALVRFTYPRNLLGRGIGINALVVAFSAAVGPTLAAGILAVGTWPWLFAINVPLGAVTLVLGLRSLPHTKPASRSFDWQSAGLSAITFGVGIAAIDSVGHGEAPALYLIQ